MKVSGQIEATLLPDKKPGAYYIGGRVGPRADIEVLVNGVISCPCRKSSPASSSPGTVVSVQTAVPGLSVLKTKPVPPPKGDKSQESQVPGKSCKRFIESEKIMSSRPALFKLCKNNVKNTGGKRRKVRLEYSHFVSRRYWVRLWASKCWRILSNKLMFEMT